MTKEQKLLSRRNNEKTAKLMNVPKGFVLHHINPELKTNDIERYILWLPEDLVILSKSEHQRIHRTGYKHSEETKKKISDSCKGQIPWNKDKVNTGLHWYTDGTSEILSRECPEGYHRGRTIK